MRKALAPRFGLVRFSIISGSQALARQHVLDQPADALGAPPLVLVAVELAADQDGVERAAVGGGEDLRVDDVAAGRRAGAGDDRQQARMVLAPAR